MFETLDIVISLAVVFLILSMIHKYMMSIIKRLLKVKASVIAKEMKAFIGEKTSPYLVKYIEEKAKYLNILEPTRSWGGLYKGEIGFRQMNEEQLKAVIKDLREYINQEPVDTINSEIKINVNSEDVNAAKIHLGNLTDRIENMYNNTLEKISESYKSKLRVITFVFGFILAIAINADFFSIYATLSTNAVSRQKIITSAEKIRTEVEILNAKIERNQNEEIEDINQEIRNAEKNISNLTTEITESGILLGWTKQKFSNAFHSRGSGINKVLGLLLSGLLISFGAPFWNDFLSSFMSARKLLYGGEKEKPASAQTGLKIPGHY